MINSSTVTDEDLTTATSSEVIRIWENQKRETFPLEHPPLRSEGYSDDRICPGWNVDAGCVNGGDALKSTEELCRGCTLEEEEFYQRKRDGVEELAYPHLTDRE